MQALESLFSNIYNISILVISAAPPLVEAVEILRRENIEQMHFCDQKQNSNKNYHSLPTLDRIGHL